MMRSPPRRPSGSIKEQLITIDATGITTGRRGWSDNQHGAEPDRHALRDRAIGIAIAYEQQTLTVTIRGDLDTVTGPELREHLARLVDSRFMNVVLDLANMGFVDRTGATAIIESLEGLPSDCKITLRSPNSSVRRVLVLFGLDGRYVIDNAPGLRVGR